MNGWTKYIYTRTSGRSAPIVLVPVPDDYKIVSHTGVGNVTKIEECDQH